MSRSLQHASLYTRYGDPEENITDTAIDEERKEMEQNETHSPPGIIGFVEYHAASTSKAVPLCEREIVYAFERAVHALQSEENDRPPWDDGASVFLDHRLHLPGVCSFSCHFACSPSCHERPPASNGVQRYNRGMPVGGRLHLPREYRLERGTPRVKWVLLHVRRP